MGRKGLSGIPSKTLIVRVSGEDWAALVKMSDAKNPVCELVREAVRRFVKSNLKNGGK